MKSKMILSFVLVCALTAGTAFASLPDTSTLTDTAKEKVVEVVKDKATELIREKADETVTKNAEDTAKTAITNKLTGK